MLDSVRIGGIGSGGIILDSVVLVVKVCTSVTMSVSVLVYQACTPSSRMRPLWNRRPHAVPTRIHSTLDIGVREYGKAYLTEDNASLIPPARTHLPVSAFCLVWG